MQAKKQRLKNRRRARRLAEQAWDAVEAGDDQMAVKLIRRATDLEPGNPVLWNDRGLLLRESNQSSAVEAFQSAIRLAPDFADPYVHLADLHAQGGEWEQAAALQRIAVDLTPQSSAHQASLRAYEALASAEAAQPVEPVLGDDSSSDSESNELEIQLSRRLDQVDWNEVADELARSGCFLLPRLLNESLCEQIAQMFECDALFRKSVTMAKTRFGAGEYRYFAAPPFEVRAIRKSVYARIAPIANRWRQRLGDEERFPEEWESFQAQCHSVGQRDSAPLLLRYQPGGFNAPHQDLSGDVFFPIQLVIVLSRRRPELAVATGGIVGDDTTGDGMEEDGFAGGDFVVCDAPERKPSDRRRLPAGQGDAVLFCTKSRFVRIAGVWGLKPVKHGVEEVRAGVRFALGVPFHEFAK